MSEENIILNIKNLTVRYKLGPFTVHAVNGVTLQVREGETMGLVGESGCGKSTMSLAIMRLLPSNGYIEKGQVIFKQEDLVKIPEVRMRKILWSEIAMVFQGAMNALNPVFKVGDQVAEALIYHEGISKEEAFEIVRELFLEVGLDPARMNDYPHQLSGGMKQRVIIAMAISMNPTLLICDEPTTALDVTIQAQIIDLLKKLQRRYGMSMIYISHDLAVVAELSDRVSVMYAGFLVEEGDVVSIYKRPAHPYTQGLIAAVPSPQKIEERRVVAIPGAPPDLRFLPNRCPFWDRCPFCKDICKEKLPDYHVIEGRRVLCHFAEDLADLDPFEAWGEYWERIEFGEAGP